MTPYLGFLFLGGFMKHDDIQGLKEIREELRDARILQVKATTEEERRKADRLVKKLRNEMAKTLFEHREERKVK